MLELAMLPYPEQRLVQILTKHSLLWRSHVKPRQSCFVAVDVVQTREEDAGASKKPRVVWSVEMHQQFVQAVNKLGIDSECSLLLDQPCLLVAADDNSRSCHWLFLRPMGGCALNTGLSHNARLCTLHTSW